MLRLFALFYLVTLLTSCATVKGWFDGDREEAVASNEESVKAPSVDNSAKEVDLKLAKLWAKVDELEDLVSKQKQRISVLERGLMLGIIPEELKSEADRTKDRGRKTMQEPIDEPELPKAPESPGLSEEKAVEAPPIAQGPKKDRQKVLAEAQEFFEQGQYGRALALYSGLDDEGDGSHRYWVGMCWYKLKEFETSHKEFSDFLAKHPSGPWAPRAKYNLAQIDFELGYKEKALTQMRKIIQDYPNEDAAQMARASIKQMETNL